MSLEKQKQGFVSQVEEAVRNKVKEQKEEEAEYLTKLESIESELKLNQTEVLWFLCYFIFLNSF